LRVLLSGDSAGAVRAFSETAAAADEASGKIEDKTSKIGSAFSKLGKYALEAGVGIGAAVSVYSVKAAADFQSSMTQLVTGAGESQKNIKAVSAGILNMAEQVGQTPAALASGMYLIESAGYHGAAGLKVLKASAEGAATGGAQMSTVADALTTAMHDYNIPADKANSVTSALIETVASGKTNLEALAGSLGKVMPQAAALGISFPNVTGAMATMTNAGLSARLASQHLSNTLLALSAPSTAAATAMGTVGLSSQQVKNALDGPGGLGSAMQMIEQHVGSTFPAGSVAGVNAFKAIMGGATGYSTALMLTGANTKTFASDTQKIGGVLQGSGKSVQGFSKTQKDLDFQIKQVKAEIDVLAIKFGDALIPKLEAAGKMAIEVAKWFEKHKAAAAALAIAIGTVLAGAIAKYAYDSAKSFMKSTKAMMSDLSALKDKLFGAAAAEEDLAVTSEESAATIQTAGDEAGSGFDAMLGPIGLVIIAGTLVATHWKEVSRLLVDAWHFIEDEAKEIWGDIVGFFKKWGEDILLAFLPVVGIPLFLATHWHEVSSDAQEIWGDIVSFFESIPGRIVSALSALGGDLLSLATSAWGDFKTGAITVFDTVLSWVKGIPGKIEDIFKDAGTWLLDAGKAIIQGLVNGIKAGLHLVSDAVGGVVSLVKHIPIIGGLIGSPSPYFTQVGQAIGDGLTNGIHGSTGRAVAAVQAAAGSLRAIPFPSLGATGSAAASLAGGTSNPYAIGGGSGAAAAGGTGNVTIQVNVSLGTLAAAQQLVIPLRTLLLQQKRAVVTLGLG
jgi:TP901 family phage tail tape measure protein